MSARIIQSGQVNTIIGILAASTVAVGVLTRVGGEYGIAPAAIASGAVGAMDFGAVIEISKPTGASTGYVLGEEIAYDSANDTTAKLSAYTGNYLGVVVEAAGDSATTVKVRLNAKRQFATFLHTADAGEDTAEAIVWDTGWGAAPTGPIIVTLTNSSGLSRAATVTKLSGGNLGKINIAATIAAGDIVNGIAYRWG